MLSSLPALCQQIKDGMSGLSVERHQIILDSLRLVEDVATDLGTTSYLWGGMTNDVYAGRLLCDHHDLDYLTVNLHPKIDEFIKLFEDAGCTTKVLINGDLKVEGAGIGIHLGHVELNDQARWIHNRNNEHGVLCFPAAWLRPNPQEIDDTETHVVEPELEFVLKSCPHLLNQMWEGRPKDRAALVQTTSILEDRCVDVKQLFSVVSVESPKLYSS